MIEERGSIGDREVGDKSERDRRKLRQRCAMRDMRGMSERGSRES